MLNINVVQSQWNFLQLKEIKKYTYLQSKFEVSDSNKLEDFQALQA